jgi:hypothetical protein
MALMPGVTHQLIGAGTNMARYDIVCVHTIVGYAPASAAHFSTRASGQIIQSRDTQYRSAANLNGNPRVIAIENEDHGAAYGSWSGSNVPAFTAQQCEAIALIILFCHRAHGIPIVLCPDSRPGSRGIAYHRQGCDGNFGGYAFGGRVSGGELWSSSVGKVCPGDRRIRQLIEVIIPRARVLAGLDAPQEEDVDLNDSMRAFIWPNTAEIKDTVGSTLANTQSYARTILTELASLRADVNLLKSRPVADVDEAALAAELEARGVTGVTPAQVKEIVLGAFGRAATEGS